MSAATDPQAQFEEATALLANPKEVPEFARAVELIESAAASGHAQSIERRALLECRGLDRAADWNKALDSLASAAERGSDLAARQLILLADDRFEETAPAAAADWSAIRSRISIGRRLEPPPPTGGKTLSADPLVHAIPGFASAAECRWLIAAGAPRLGRATIYSRPGGVDPSRTNRSAVFDLANLDLVITMIQTRIANEIGAPLPVLETPQTLHYEVGQEFALHFDFLDPRVLGDEIARLGQRAATFLIYLNEEFEGGETSFPRIGINHRGKTGDALVFGNLDRAGQPNFRAQHAGLPPTRGEKWVFSQWVRDRGPG